MSKFILGNGILRHQLNLHGKKKLLQINILRFKSTLKPVTSIPSDLDTKKIIDSDPSPELGPLLSKLPKSWSPYIRLARLEKPVGSWLLFIPGAWSITAAGYILSAPLSTIISTTALFGIGSLIMRGAGCTINDMLDKDLDSKVSRTISRPMASGQVSMKQATAFLAAQCTAGLGVLLSLPLEIFPLGAASLLFVGTYPLFKRFTYYPQLMLSLTFNWGALLGYAAVASSSAVSNGMAEWNWPVMGGLYSAGVLWCMIYDTIYAHQDKKWDVLAGIKSTALKWGTARSRSILSVLGTSQIGILVGTGVVSSLGPGYFIGTSIMAYRIFRMIKTVNFDNPKDCWKAFISNIYTGNYLWAGLFF